MESNGARTRWARRVWLPVVVVASLGTVRLVFYGPSLFTLQLGVILSAMALCSVGWAYLTSAPLRWVRRRYPDLMVRAIAVRPSQHRGLAPMFPGEKFDGVEVRMTVTCDRDGLGFWSREVPSTILRHVPWKSLAGPVEAVSTPTTFGHEAAIRIDVSGPPGAEARVDLIVTSTLLWGKLRARDSTVTAFAIELELLRTARGSARERRTAVS